MSGLLPAGPPPLPLGWSEHVGPGGQSYYYNAHTQESTYIRPLPLLPLPQPSQVRKGKEKPLVKTQISGTDWLRVKTTEGNVFYSHKVTKESIWTVPEEIRDAVEALERKEKTKPEQVRVEAGSGVSQADRESQLEIERIKSEVSELVKRKAESPVLLDEVVISKKPRLEEKEEEESEESEEEEEWQREAAEQLALEAEEERQRVEEETKRIEEAAAAQNRKVEDARSLFMPDRVDLSVDEAKALFKTLLREKDINPLYPWDTSLPLFVSDPRYVLLPSVSARREAFDEYCRDRARELRQMNVKKEKEVAMPKESFENLLKEEVKSTRTTWTEFRRNWKKDRRFWGWGRDDREREKRFKEFIRDLGEKKRAAAKKAEADFFTLLKENEPIHADSSWKDVKRKISDDHRYDAVGSSSLREELFSTFLKARASGSAQKPADEYSAAEASLNETSVTHEDREQKIKERKERAVREREEKVKAERGRVEADIGRSRIDLNKEEGEREFMTMLTDAVRDPQITWDAILPQLKTDPRFTQSPLPLNQQLHLFHTHVAQLRSRHLTSLHSLFDSHAPSLSTTFPLLPLPSLLSSLPVTKLGLNADALEHEFDKWQRERTHQFRKAFDEMLGENSFIEFWGRLSKIAGEGVDGGVKADETEEDEGEGGGGKVDMKALAKSVDVYEMEKVLKNDKRYILFEHVPEQREKWIRDYLSQLSAPKLSVHVHEHAI